MFNGKRWVSPPRLKITYKEKESSPKSRLQSVYITVECGFQRSGVQRGYWVSAIDFLRRIIRLSLRSRIISLSLYCRSEFMGGSSIFNDVMKLAADGLKPKEISERLGVGIWRVSPIVDKFKRLRKAETECGPFLLKTFHFDESNPYLVGLQEIWDDNSVSFESSRIDKLMLASRRQALRRFVAQFVDPSLKMPTVAQIRIDIGLRTTKEKVKSFNNYAVSQGVFWGEVAHFAHGFSGPNRSEFEVLSELVKEKCGFVEPHFLTINDLDPVFEFESNGQIRTNGNRGSYPFTESVVSRINKRDPKMKRNFINAWISLHEAEKLARSSWITDFD